MQTYSLSHVADDVLLDNLAAFALRDRANTAMLLAHIAEVDARKLYAPAKYHSMHEYCVEVLKLSEDEAKKRIQAARAARRFPAIFHELAEGRLHLTGVCLLAPYLTPETARELIDAASDRKKWEIEELLARHFEVSVPVPRPVAPISSEGPATMQALGVDATPDEGAPEHLPELQSALPPPKPVSYFIQVTVSKETHDKLRYLQGPLSHAVPGGDLAPVLDRALDRAIEHYEKKRFGVSERAWTKDVLSGLRSLGCPAKEARRAADSTSNLHGATLEERMTAALRFLDPTRSG